jgi:hypothetical protein
MGTIGTADVYPVVKRPDPEADHLVPKLIMHEAVLLLHDVVLRHRDNINLDVQF